MNAAAAAAGSVDVKSSEARSECVQMIIQWKRTVTWATGNRQRVIYNQIRRHTTKTALRLFNEVSQCTTLLALYFMFWLSRVVAAIDEII